MKGYIRRGLIGSVACASALALALATAGTARAGNGILMAEGGTTDSNSDTGHLVMAGLINTKSDGTAKSLNITISYQDNVGVATVDTDGFVCNLTTATDFAPAGGGTTTITVSASDDLCFRMTDPSVTFSNAGNSITFKAYTSGGKTRFVVTSSTLVDSFDDSIDNVAIAGEIDPSSGGSDQAGGNRLIIGSGGAVDPDDTGSPSGHMALAGEVTLQPVRKGEAHAEAKDLDMDIEYQDFFGTQHMSCHLTTPSDVAYNLNKGVGTITFTVSAGDSCTNNGHSNTGNSITFTLYAAGAKGRIVSTASTLVNSDGGVIGDVAVVGEFSTPGGS